MLTTRHDLDPDLDDELLPTKTTGKKGWRMPTDDELQRALHPRPIDRAITFLGWHTPELVTGAVLATGGGMVSGALVWLGLAPAAVTTARWGAQRLRYQQRRRQITGARTSTQARVAQARDHKTGDQLGTVSGTLDWPTDEPADEDEHAAVVVELRDRGTA